MTPKKLYYRIELRFIPCGSATPVDSSVGNRSDSILFVERGTAKLMATSVEGKEAVVTILKDGDVFRRGGSRFRSVPATVQLRDKPAGTGLPIVLDVIAVEEPITLLRTIDRNRCLRSTDGK